MQWAASRKDFFHSSPQSSLLDAFSFLPMFSQPRSLLAGQLSYVYYYLLFLSVKWKHFYLVIPSLHWPALSPRASLCSTLQGLTPLVPENAGAVKLHSAWQHHFYSKLHIIIIDLEVWPPCYTASQADSFFPETTFQCLLCPHGDQNVMVIRSFEDYAMFIKRPPEKYFFVLCTVLKNLLPLVSTTMSHLFENEHVCLQISKSMFTPHSKG